MTRYRLARAEDIPAVVTLEREIFSLPWSGAGFRAELDSPDAAFYLALEDEVLAGFAVIPFFPDEAEVFNVAVNPGFRRRGIARRLMELCLEEAGRRGTKRVLLEVRQSNAAARALYSGLGFQVLGLRRGYYEEPREDAIMMEFCPDRI